MSMAQELPARGNRQVSYLCKDADSGNSILNAGKALSVEDVLALTGD
jgi:hypothetical protein